MKSLAELRKQTSRQQMQALHQQQAGPLKPRVTSAAGVNASSSSNVIGSKPGKNRFNPEKVIMAIEKFSVIIFLFSFLAFNVFYWLDIMATVADNEERQ